MIYRILCRLVNLILLGCLSVAFGAQDEAPAWIEDSANSRWITFGSGGPVEGHGIRPLKNNNGEGVLTPAVRGGVACVQSLRDDDSQGYFYLLTEPGNAFSAWAGDDDVLLTVRYYDGAPGRMIILYDSSDARVKNPHYAAGVWRCPDAYPRGVELKAPLQDQWAVPGSMWRNSAPHPGKGGS